MRQTRVPVAPMITTEQVPLARRVLQCPVLIDWQPEAMTVALGSRDEANRSRIISVDLTLDRGGRWIVDDCRLLLSAEGVSMECVGVMPGDVVPRNGGRVLAGNAYFRAGSILISRVFTIDLTLPEGAPAAISWMCSDQSDRSFEATPGILQQSRRQWAIYPVGVPDPDGSFPAEYQFQITELSESLVAQQPGRPLFTPAPAATAMAKFAQDPARPERAWFSHRCPDSGYQLGRCLLDADGLVRASWWQGNGGLGLTPEAYQMLSYPEPLPDGRVLVCTGRYGDQGLAMVDASPAVWTSEQVGWT